MVFHGSGSSKWHDKSAVVHHVSYSNVNQGQCGANEDRDGLESAPHMSFLNHFDESSSQYVWLTVQAYDADGIGKGTGWSRGEIGFWHNTNDYGRYIDRPENVGAEEQE